MRVTEVFILYVTQSTLVFTRSAVDNSAHGLYAYLDKARNKPTLDVKVEEKASLTQVDLFVSWTFLAPGCVTDTHAGTTDSELSKDKRDQIHKDLSTVTMEDNCFGGSIKGWTVSFLHNNKYRDSTEYFSPLLDARARFTTLKDMSTEDSLLICVTGILQDITASVHSTTPFTFSQNSSNGSSTLMEDKSIIPGTSTFPVKALRDLDLRSCVEWRHPSSRVLVGVLAGIIFILPTLCVLAYIYYRDWVLRNTYNPIKSQTMETDILEGRGKNESDKMTSINQVQGNPKNHSSKIPGKIVTEHTEFRHLPETKIDDSTAVYPQTFKSVTTDVGTMTDTNNVTTRTECLHNMELQTCSLNNYKTSSETLTDVHNLSAHVNEGFQGYPEDHLYKSINKADETNKPMNSDQDHQNQTGKGSTRL